ncbi:MAG: PepSY domain-containing protein [Gemmatimonadetes bacterium]|nr:PepSY domain-containing protein [Gemmatimonadota bacterium]
MRFTRAGMAVVLLAVTSVAAQAQAKPAAPAAAKPATADQAVKVKEDKPGLLKKAKITAEAAIATAQAKFPKAKISEAEIEDEDGKLIYSFALKTEGKSGIDEVNVDAMTGKVLKTEHESPEDEAKEAKADKAKADKDKAAAAKPAPKKPV